MPVVLLPVAALLIVIVVGSMALASESRAAPTEAETSIREDPHRSLSGGSALALARSQGIGEEPTGVPSLPGPEALRAQLENDPELLRAFGHVRTALADPRMRPEVLRAGIVCSGSEEQEVGKRYQICLAFDAPPDPQQRRQDFPGLGGRPPTPGATAKTLSICGTGSP